MHMKLFIGQYELFDDDDDGTPARPGDDAPARPEGCLAKGCFRGWCCWLCTKGYLRDCCSWLCFSCAPLRIVGPSVSDRYILMSFAIWLLLMFSGAFAGIFVCPFGNCGYVDAPSAFLCWHAETEAACLGDTLPADWKAGALAWIGNEKGVELWPCVWDDHVEYGYRPCGQSSEPKLRHEETMHKNQVRAAEQPPNARYSAEHALCPCHLHMPSAKSTLDCAVYIGLLHRAVTLVPITVRGHLRAPLPRLLDRRSVGVGLLLGRQ